jgi:hypothetical protein
MRGLDFSSWQTLVVSFVGIALVTLIGVAIRLVLMQTMQHRRDRENRQINERLRTLIAAYKTLGGSFTGDLDVDPRHKRNLKDPTSQPAGDRTRRIRDAVESALSDIILLGTDEQVRLATLAATELVAGRPVETSALVISLRTFIREALALTPIPPDFTIPRQGPTRTLAKGSPDSSPKDDTKSGGSDLGGGPSPFSFSKSNPHDDDPDSNLSH